MPAGKPHVDPIITSSLRSPMLDQVMGSQVLKESLTSIANEVKRRYISKVPKESGKLAQTVRVKPFRSKVYPDRRWMVDVNIGGIMGVDYADDIEREYGILASVLREMGYNTGDVVNGPRGRGAKEAPPKPPRRTAKSQDEKQAEMAASTSAGYSRVAEAVDRIMRPGRKVGSKSYDADYEELKRITAEVEAQYGAEDASVGRTAMATYRAFREAKGLSSEPGGDPRPGLERGQIIRLKGGKARYIVMVDDGQTVVTQKMDQYGYSTKRFDSNREFELEGKGELRPPPGRSGPGAMGPRVMRRYEEIQRNSRSKDK